MIEDEDRFITYRDQNLISSLYSTYYKMSESARSIALCHVKNKDNENYNNFHFEHAIRYMNEALREMVELIPPNDKRIDKFELFSKEVLIKEAEKFLSTDLY